MSENYFLIDKSNRSSYLENFSFKGENEVSATDENFYISSGENKLKIDRNAFRLHLEKMKSVVDVQIFKLSEADNQILQSIIEVTRLISRNDSLYPIIIKDIQDIFNDVETIIPGSVGAFFIGCNKESEFSGPLGCDPRCANSLPPPGNFESYSKCKDSVYMFSGGEIRILIDQLSSHCYLYIDTDNYSKLNDDHIKFLTRKGINEVTLVIGSKTYDHVSNRIALANVISYMDQNYVKKTESTEESSSNTNYSAYFLIFLLLIIILIIIFVVIFFRTK